MSRIIMRESLFAGAELSSQLSVEKNKNLRSVVIRGFFDCSQLERGEERGHAASGRVAF